MGFSIRRESAPVQDPGKRDDIRSRGHGCTGPRFGRFNALWSRRTTIACCANRFAPWFEPDRSPQLLCLRRRTHRDDAAPRPPRARASAGRKSAL